MYAQLGTDPRDEVNSKRSIIGTKRVSDSFLKPEMINGELIRVNDVEIIGDIYVRMAGRDDVAIVWLKEVRNVRETMKLPVDKLNAQLWENQFPGCFL